MSNKDPENQVRFTRETSAHSFSRSAVLMGRISVAVFTDAPKPVAQRIQVLCQVHRTIGRHDLEGFGDGLAIVKGNDAESHGGV